MVVRVVELGDTSFLVVGRYWIPTDDMDLDTAEGASSNQVVIRRRSSDETVTFSEEASKAILRFLEGAALGYGLPDDE